MDNDQVNPGGDQDQIALGWRSALPDEWKNHNFVKAYQKPGDFVKSAYEIAQDRDGLKTRLENSIPKLSENATDAEKEAFYRALGKPEKADEYQITVPEGVPEDSGAVQWFKDTAHKIGMPKQMAEAFVNNYFEKLKSDIANNNKLFEERVMESENKLKQEWGGKYQENIDLARNTARKSGGEEFTKWLNDTGIGSFPEIIRVFHKIGTLVSEDSFVRGIAPEKEMPMTPGGKPMLHFPSMEQR